MSLARSIVVILLAALPIAATAATALAADRPVVVFVPGFMCSDLYDGDRRIWIDQAPGSFAAEFDRLVIPQGPAAPGDGLVARHPMKSYDGFLASLARHATVVPFAYDWRQSSAASAAALDRFLAEEETLRDAATVTLVAHSMGGLLAMLLTQNPEGRYANSAKVGKVVTLGTPYLGSVQSVEVAFHGMGLLPRERLAGTELQKALNSFPGFYDMLPRYLDGPDGLSCCMAETAAGGDPRPLELWSWEGWSSLAWDPDSYRPEAVKRTLSDAVGQVRAAAERWRHGSLPDWLFPIAGLTDLDPGAPDARGLARTTSLAFLARDGRLDSGAECSGNSTTCAYGDQVIAQFSATLGRANDRVGPAGRTCSVRMGKGPDGPYYHSDMVDDPAVRETVFAALAAPSNGADWCRGP